MSSNYLTYTWSKVVLFVCFQDIWELRPVLLCETLHEIWAIFNRDLDWNILDNEERSAVKAKGENIWLCCEASVPQSLHTAYFSRNLNTSYLILAKNDWGAIPLIVACCRSSGKQHLAGSSACHSWLHWLDWPTSSGRPQPIHLSRMPSTRDCTDHSGLWLWPGSY